MFSIGDAGGMGGGYPCVSVDDADYDDSGEHKANGATASDSPKGDSFGAA